MGLSTQAKLSVRQVRPQLQGGSFLAPSRRWTVFGEMLLLGSQQRVSSREDCLGQDAKRTGTTGLLFNFSSCLFDVNWLKYKRELILNLNARDLIY